MKRTPVKRRYDAAGRQRAAEQTRIAILHAARRLFLARGYARTTVADIAGEAEVAVDTVYASIGTKQALMQTLVEHAISGLDRAVPAEERDYVRAIRAEPDARKKLALYAHAIRQVHERLAPLTEVLKAAAAADEDLARLWKKIADRRAANMRLFAADLEATGQLREGVDVEEAADVIWATNATELYVLLVDGRGWSPDKFEVWLAGAWMRLLLRD